MACGSSRKRDGHSSGTPVARRILQPTRMTGPDGPRGFRLNVIPIRSCSRWGLPCRFRRRKRGALLPHRFTLTAAKTLRSRGGLFSVALSLGFPPKGPPAGCYPAPFVHGARTFLPAPPFGIGTERPSGRLTPIAMGAPRPCVKFARRSALKKGPDLSGGGPARAASLLPPPLAGEGWEGGLCF